MKKTLENFSFSFQNEIKNSTILGGRIKNIDIEMKNILLIVKLWQKHKSETKMDFLDISLTKDSSLLLSAFHSPFSLQIKPRYKKTRVYSIHE